MHIRITIVCPFELPLDLFDTVGDSRGCVKDVLAEKGATRSLVRSITVAIAALGPPERTPGLVPSLLHSVHSPCVQCTLQTISRWLPDVCRRRRRLREKNPAYAYTVDDGSYAPSKESGAAED